MAKHKFKLDSTGAVDTFVVEYDFHNGPECIACGKAVCHHCNPEIYTEECPGGDDKEDAQTAT